MNIHNMSDRVLTFERRFEAPRDVVFSLFTHPRHVVRWFGPRGHSLAVCEQEFREGGTWRYCMTQGAQDVWVWGTYHEIVEPEKLVFSYSMDFHRYETLVTIHFEDLGATTLMRFRQGEFISRGDCNGHHWGWMSALDKLSEHILRLQGAGLLHADPYDRRQRDPLAEDFAEAAERAKTERDSGMQIEPPTYDATSEVEYS